MKIAAIKKRCLEMGTFAVLRDGQGRCWISNTSACWPTDGMEIGEGNIQALFDLKPRKMRKLLIREMVINHEWLCMEPLPRDMNLKMRGHVYDAGDLYVVLEDDRGFIRLINAKLLEPAGDADLRFFLRVDDGGTERIVAFGDLLASAIVGAVTSEKAAKIMGTIRALADAPLAVTREKEGV